MPQSDTISLFLWYGICGMNKMQTTTNLKGIQMKTTSASNSVKIRFYHLLFLTSLLLLGGTMYHGCSEDNSSTNPPTNPPTGSIGTLSITPDILTVNTPDTLFAKLTVPSGTYFTDSSAKLVKTDDNGNTVSEIGILYDNGLILNGDDIKGDNVYSGKFIVTETSAGTIKLKATGNVSSGTATATLSSQVFSISVYGQLNSGQVNVVLSTQNNAKGQLVTYLGGNPNNIETAVGQLKTWLESQPGVASVVRDGNTALNITYTNGLTGGMIMSVNETRGGMSSDTGRRQAVVEIPASRQTIGVNDFFATESGRGNTDNILIDNNTIGNRSVLIVSPYEAVWVNNERPVIIARLQNAPCKNFTVKSLINTEATVTSLFDMTQYGYIVFATHGSNGKAILTGERVDTNAAVYKETYKALLQAGRISIFSNIKITNTGTAEDRGDVWAITNLFISNLSGTFPNTIILNNSCSSTKNPDLANAFIGKGCKTYFGYDKTVNGAFAKMIADSITKRMAITGLTSGQSYFAAADPQSPNANFQKGPGNNDDLKYSLSLENSDFESGKIDGWTKIGDGRVINRLGTLGADQGTFMGIISTGLGFTTSSGSISQCFTVANNQSQLTIRWNFLSEEFLEYIHSQFQDYFRIVLKKQDGSEVTLLSKNIDQIAVQFGADTNMVGQLVAVSPGIVFDQGGVYMTNWQTSTFDVTPYRGQTIVIEFICGDVGDSIYDTAILLDAIKVN